MAQRYEYQDIDGHVILLFVHPACILENGDSVNLATNRNQIRAASKMKQPYVYLMKGITYLKTFFPLDVRYRPFVGLEILRPDKS